MNNDENLRMLLHRLADSSPVAKMTRKGREKMIELGLSEEEADAVIQRYLCGGFEFERKETK